MKKVNNSEIDSTLFITLLKALTSKITVLVGYPSKKFTGTFKKYSRNFKEGKKNDKELTFRINGEVVKIAHFTAGIKNGWSLHFKKNHGLAVLKYKYKTSHESIVKAVFYKDGEVIHNPFILASQPKLF